MTAAVVLPLLVLTACKQSATSPDAPADSLTEAAPRDLDTGPDAQAVDSLRAALDAFEAAAPPTATDSTRLRRWADSLMTEGRSLRGRQPTRARGYLQQALRARRALSDTAQVASIISEIGVTHYYQSQYEKALSRFQKALVLYRERGRRGGVAEALNRIGNVHENQGRYSKALTHLRESLTIARELENQRDIAAALTNLGIVYKKQGRYEEALQHYREVLPMSRELEDQRVNAYVLNNVGNVYEEQGRYERALRAYRNALTIQREREDKRGIAAVLYNIGIVHEKQSRYQRALRRYRQALRLNRDLGRRLGTALNLSNIGIVHLETGRGRAATDTLDRAVRLAEELRLNATSPEARRSLLSTQIDAYQALTTAHVRSGRSGAALRSVEQARARLLIDQLAGATREDTTFSVPSQAALRRTLAPDEAALLYTNVDSSWPLMVVVATKDTVYTRELPSSTIRAAIGARHSAQLRRLTRDEAPLAPARESGPSVVDDGAPTLKETIRLYRHHLRREGISSIQTDLARHLHRLLLAPVAPTLQKKKTVTVVPTGVLGYLPFETLRTASGQYLIETTQVRYAQSLTVLRQLQNRTYSPSRRPLLALGGASYDRSPSQGKGPLVASVRSDSTVQTREQASTLLRTAERRLERGRSPGATYAQLGYDRWPPLYGTKLEVQKLKRVSGRGARVLTGPAASEEQIRRMSAADQLARYRHVHFATHGMAVPEAPALSALVLSQNRASDSLAAADGYLTMNEIAELNLRADVAVLSACQTGLGKVVAGEGVVSLSHAFLRAGANATLVSQWRVPDWSTQQFMAAVYRRADEEDTSFTDATAAVKRAFIDGQFGARNTDPLRWAPFVYYGRE